jgi:hypothetical protein
VIANFPEAMAPAEAPKKNGVAVEAIANAASQSVCSLAPDDSRYIVDYAFLLRSPDGSVETVHDRHVEGLFSREEWLARFAAAGIPAMSEPDPWGRDVFVGVKPG